MTLIKSISGIRGTIGGGTGKGLTPLDMVKFTSAYATLIRRTCTVKNNKIVVGDSEMTLTNYMNKYHKRGGNTNEHNGYQYFTYKGILIYNMWQDLVGVK